MGGSSSKKTNNENNNKNDTNEMPEKITIIQKEKNLENEHKNEIKPNNLSNNNNPNYMNNPNYTNNINYPNNQYQNYTNNFNSYNPYNLNNSYNQNNSDNKNNSYNQNNLDAPFQRYFSVPISNYEKNPLLYEKDDNLELRDYFKSNDNDNNVEDLNTYYNINKTYEDIKNRINYKNNNSNSERELLEINEKINLDFGFKKEIEKDFKRTKTSILYCSSLSLNDENYINSLDYDKYKREESQSKTNILKIINSNMSFFIQLTSKFDSKK